MAKSYDLQVHNENLEAHKKSAAQLDRAAEDLPLAQALRQEARAEETQSAEDLLLLAQKELDQARAEYDRLIAEGKPAGDIENNPELLQAAYAEHIQYLRNELNELNSRANVVKDQIKQFSHLLAADASGQLEQAKKDSVVIPDWVLKQLPGRLNDQGRIRFDVYIKYFAGGPSTTS